MANPALTCTVVGKPFTTDFLGASVASSSFPVAISFGGLDIMIPLVTNIESVVIAHQNSEGKGKPKNTSIRGRVSSAAQLGAWSSMKNLFSVPKSQELPSPIVCRK